MSAWENGPLKKSEAWKELVRAYPKGVTRERLKRERPVLFAELSMSELVYIPKEKVETPKPRTLDLPQKKNELPVEKKPDADATKKSKDVPSSGMLFTVSEMRKLFRNLAFHVRADQSKIGDPTHFMRFVLAKRGLGTTEERIDAQSACALLERYSAALPLLDDQKAALVGAIKSHFASLR